MRSAERVGGVDAVNELVVRAHPVEDAGALLVLVSRPTQSVGGAGGGCRGDRGGRVGQRTGRGEHRRSCRGHGIGWDRRWERRHADLVDGQWPGRRRARQRESRRAVAQHPIGENRWKDAAGDDGGGGGDSM